MTEMTRAGTAQTDLTQTETLPQTQALRQAAALVGQALKETETRCAVLGQYINDCNRTGSAAVAGTGALRELRALHDRRAGLLHQGSLIQQALDCFVAEPPVQAPLYPPAPRPAFRARQQIQIHARRR